MQIKKSARVRIKCTIYKQLYLQNIQNKISGEISTCNGGWLVHVLQK